MLKLDIAAFLDRYLLERVHGPFEQPDVGGIGRFAGLRLRTVSKA
jgi:hypothetical protein